MGLISNVKGWFKGIFSRKPKQTKETEEKEELYTEAPTIPEYQEPAKLKILEKKPEKKTTKAELLRPTPRTTALKAKIQAQQRKISQLENKFEKASTEGVVSVNNLQIQAQEYLNSTNIRNQYDKLLRGKVLGKDQQLMDDIYNNRDSILRHRLSSEVIITDNRGREWIRFQMQGVLIEELTLVKNFIRQGDPISLESQDRDKEYFFNNIFNPLKEQLLMNNVRGIGVPVITIQNQESKEFVVGNVAMNVNYA